MSKSEASSDLTRKRKCFFAIGVTLFFWISVELLLRAAGFSYQTNVESMRFTFPVDEYNESSDEPFLEHDNDLFWKVKPNVLGHNSLGIVGPEFDVAKSPGMYRIVCLGDSCTHFGPDSYPELLHQQLQQSSSQEFEVINAGCIGYTSYQGLVRLRTQVLDWSPDLITVYFGWNDHWLARGYRDSQQPAASSAQNRLGDRLEVSRIWQLANYVRGNMRGNRQSQMRVTLAEYEANLRAIHRDCNERGIEVWFLTAPHAFDHSVPEYLISSGEVADSSKILSIHRQYNAVVRKVAADLNCVCCDLADEFDSLNKSELLVDDHIHLSASGRAYVAERLQREIDANRSFP